VHDLPLTKFLQRDDSLRSLLEALPQRKWIFSNADRAHIERVLSVLGLTGVCDGIIDIYATGFTCKPFDRAYALAMTLASAPNPEVCLLVDDQPRNLEPAARLGMTTVLVHPRSLTPSDCFSISSIHDLPFLMTNQLSL